MDLTRGVFGGIVYSVVSALKLRRVPRMPIQLLKFPCVELEGMTICAANENARELLGENPAGRPFVALLDEGARIVWRRESLRRMVRGVRYLGETCLRCRNGQVRARLLMMRDGGRNLIMFSAQGDEDRPLKARGAAFSGDGITELVHEMRAPLTVICSAATLMRERPGAVEQYLQGIERSCERLQNMVNDIMALGSEQGDMLNPAPVRFDMAAWLEDQIALIRPQAQCRGVELLFTSAPGELNVNTDPKMLEHIIVNLIGNALKFTPGGGHISVRLEVTFEDIIITVTDTGRGIAPTELGRIFERGYTGDAQRGYGIGLALAARCAHILGGQLNAFSDGQSGSTFTLSLPSSIIVPPNI